MSVTVRLPEAAHAVARRLAESENRSIGDVIVVLNPAVDPPARIPEFAEKANDTDGIVIGIATDKFRRSLFYRFAYQAYYGLCRIFLTRSQVYGATHFMALTRTAGVETPSTGAGVSSGSGVPRNQRHSTRS